MTTDCELLPIYGCTYSQLQAWKGKRGRIARAYREHRTNAMRRKIPFLLTFGEWLAIWTASGHFQQRGRGAFQYVMTRKNDLGPYSAENVIIQSASSNLADGRARAKVFAKVFSKA